MESECTEDGGRQASRTDWVATSSEEESTRESGKKEFMSAGSTKTNFEFKMNNN